MSQRLWHMRRNWRCSNPGILKFAPLSAICKNARDAETPGPDDQITLDTQCQTKRNRRMGRFVERKSAFADTPHWFGMKAVSILRLEIRAVISMMKSRVYCACSVPVTTPAFVEGRPSANRLHNRRHHIHSMTLSARSTSPAGISRSIAAAVLRLMASSKFDGCSTGTSAGLAPRNILTICRAR